MIDPELEITLIGFSHRTAPVAVRERFAIQEIDLSASHESIASIPEIEEVFVLSTCNRTELLIAARKGFDPTREAVTRIFRNLDSDHLYVFRELEAVIHLFRVASGLDSMVLGESEVLSQVKKSYEIASATKSLGKTLDPLVQHAISVGKRVRTETGLGEGTLSVARVGVDIAKRVFGSFEERNATIVGAGETGVLVARHLTSLGISNLTFLNRTLENAQRVAAEFGAESRPLDELSAALRRTDLVICAVDGAEHLIRPGTLNLSGLGHRDRPLLFIDLSVPRAVDPEVSELTGVLLYNLDDLGQVVETNLSTRKQALQSSDRIVVGEMHKFLALRVFKSFSPAIAALHGEFDRVREEVLDSVAKDRATPDQIQLAHELSRRLLDVALGQMKQSARHSQSETALESEYQRYLENL